MTDMAYARVFVPASLAGLTELARTGTLPAGTGYTATARLAAALPDLDEEELDYQAMCDAVEAAGRPRGGRRIVVACDVPALALTDADDDSGTLVTMPAGIEHTRLAALFVDDPGAGDDEELSWYDVTELADVIASLEASPK